MSMTTSGFLEKIWQDLKYALRTMGRNPAFAAAIILTVALGIGANTAMFSVIRAVLLKPLAYQDPDKLVLISEGATLVHFDELKAANKSYTEIAAFSGPEDMALSGTGEPEVLKAARVSGNFLSLLGINPLLGRSFFPDEDKPGAPPVALVSAELWRRRFNRDPSIVGKTVTLAGMSYSIVGVLPAEFQFPFSGADVWVTRPAEWSAISVEGRAISPFLSVVGRLKSNVSIQQADAELAVLNQQYATAHPGLLDAKPDSTEGVQLIKDELVSDVRPKLWMLFGAVGLVLLIVCANLASLLLARATSRSREFAVRAAIGAGRARIIGQLLAESLLLASIGGALSIALAALSLKSIQSLTFVDLPRSGEIRIDGAVFGFALALSLITGLLFGLAPALAASKPDLAGVLRGSGEAASVVGPKRRFRFHTRGLLVVGQVALSTVLLIGATLLIESLARVYKVDPGFRTSNLLTMSVALPAARYDTDQKRAMFYQELVERATALPGVRSAAVTLTLPMTDMWMGQPVQLAGAPPVNPTDRPIAVFQDITPAFFRTMEIPLKRGREFTAQDDAKSVPVAIVNEKLVHLFWPEYPSGPNPIGRSILLGMNPQPLEIVGISPTVRQYNRDEDPKPEVFLPLSQKPPLAAMLAVRTSGTPLSFANAIRHQVLSIDGAQPVSAVASMDELVEKSEGQLRLMMMLLGVFAGVATLIAVVGLYGVIAYSVAQRTKEMGIRRALGAQRGNILSLVVGQGLRLALAGVVLGAGGAFLLTRLMQDLLFQVSATDPVTFMGIAILFVAVAIAASYVPARRASDTDPMSTLRLG
jgi:putative ABC transport system permease protein